MPSTPAEATFPTSPPDRVGDIEALATETSLAVNFTAPLDNGDALERYRVYVCDEQAADVCETLDVAGASPLSTSVVASGLPRGRNWTVAVEAINGEGSSES